MLRRKIKLENDGVRTAVLGRVVRNGLFDMLPLKQGPEEIREQATGYLGKQYQAEGIASANTCLSIFYSFHLEAFLNTLQS